MFLVVLIAIEARAGVVDDEAYLAATYGALVGTVAVMYWRAARRRRSRRRRSPRQLAVAEHGGGRVASWSRRRCPKRVRIAVAAVGMAVVIVPGDRAVRAAWRTFPPLDEEHLVERLGAFTIIVCGESFVKVAIAVSDSTVDGVDVVALAFQFVLTFALWASYFEDIPHAGINQRRLAPWLGASTW